MKPFSFVHAADLHLGYNQYNLDVCRIDFNAAFQELVDKTIELVPDFMILAGDIFDHARHSNSTLEAAITNFRRLRDAGIPVRARNELKERLAEAISRLKAIEQIIAVTRNEAFAEKAEHVIRIEKEAGVSQIHIEK